MKIKKALFLGFSNKKEYYNDTCPICQENINIRCSDCQKTTNHCATTMGECKHIFHSHCINKWLLQSKKCPIDNKPYKSC